MPQNRFRPIHAAHAIVEHLIFFGFTPPIEREMTALITLKDDLIKEFPRSETLKSIHVQIVNDGPTSQEIKEAAGIVLSKLGHNGQVDWQININRDNISIHCTNYTRWEEVWTSNQEYIVAIFSKMSGSRSFLTSLGAKWLDQFIYEGDEKDYDASEILNRESLYLSPHAFNSGLRWHCHTGWFDRLSAKDQEILNQLNIDSSQINDGGRIRMAVTIDHNQQITADHRIDLLGDFHPTNPLGLIALSGLMETLHDGNKRVVADLLNEATRRMIGLEGES